MAFASRKELPPTLQRPARVFQGLERKNGRMYVGLSDESNTPKPVGEGGARARGGGDGSLCRLRAQTPGLTALRRGVRKQDFPASPRAGRGWGCLGTLSRPLTAPTVPRARATDAWIPATRSPSRGSPPLRAPISGHMKLWAERTCQSQCRSEHARTARAGWSAPPTPTATPARHLPALPTLRFDTTHRVPVQRARIMRVVHCSCASSV